MSDGVLIVSVNTHHLVSARWVHPDDLPLAGEPAATTRRESNLSFLLTFVFRGGGLIFLQQRRITEKRAAREMAAN